MLLILYNVAPRIPVRLHKRRVCGGGDSLAGTFEQLADCANKVRIRPAINNLWNNSRRAVFLYALAFHLPHIIPYSPPYRR